MPALIDIPKLTERIKTISTTYDPASQNTSEDDKDPYFFTLSSLIKTIVLKNQTTVPEYWKRGGIRMVATKQFKACLEKVKPQTKVLGKGYYGSVYNVPTSPCIKRIPLGVKHVGVKVESLKSEGDSNQTPERLGEVIKIAKRAAELKIGPKLYDVFIIVEDDGLARIIKIFEVIEGTSWDNHAWESAEEKKAAIKTLESHVHTMNEAGIIHHDLHGGNVMVGKSGKIYIIDYDMASMVENEEQMYIKSFRNYDEGNDLLSQKAMYYIYTKLKEDGYILITSAKNKGATTRKNKRD